jgi:hypothetical protein
MITYDGLGDELSFFTPRYSFPARKKRFFVGHNTKYRNFSEKQAKDCGQTKINNVALSPSQGETTSTLMHPMAYTIAQPKFGIGRNTFVQTFSSLLQRLR